MTQLNPLTPIANRLYRVQVADCCYVSGIEAPDARAAMTEAECSFAGGKNEFAGKSLSATCEQIYEASIGLETDGRDNAPNDADTENGVFEIKIRGCDPNRVNELKRALLYLIGGPGLDEEDQVLVGSTLPLKRAIEGMMFTSY